MNDAPSLGVIRERARDQLARLGERPTYPVLIERNLEELRDRLVREANPAD